MFPVASLITPTIRGPRKLLDLSVIEYNPYHRASSPCGISSENTARENAWKAPKIEPETEHEHEQAEVDSGLTKIDCEGVHFPCCYKTSHMAFQTWQESQAPVQGNKGSEHNKGHQDFFILELEGVLNFGP
jgi:hypothetical protein